MELTILLDDAITSIQNLEDYYLNQIDSVMEQIEVDAQHYKYGVVLGKYFFSKIIETDDIKISEQEKEILDSILESCDIQQTEENVIVQYKIKNQSEIEKDFELNPHKAQFEYLRLMERPQILNDSTIIMLLVRYEEAIAGILKYLINKYPVAYLSEKTITYAELIAMSSDIKDIKERFIEKEVEDIMRQPLSDWYEIFRSKHKAQFDVKSEEFVKFKEIYYRRNLVVHNQSIVNEIYLSNVNTELKKGNKLDIDKDYLKEAFKLTEKVLYNTFWGLKKVSNKPQQLQESLFDIGFKHMLNLEWELSEHIYKFLKEEKEQSEADKIRSTINYWLSIKNQGRLEEILKEIQEFDISARSGDFKVAKYALLNDYEKVSETLESVIDNEIPASFVETWPLFLQYRETDYYIEFRNNHKDLFAIQDYQPEYLNVDSDEEEILEEFGEQMELIDLDLDDFV